MSTFSVLLSHDPIAMLELVAICMTLAFVGRLTFSEIEVSGCSGAVYGLRLQRGGILKGLESLGDLKRRIFDVGNLISTPNRSLEDQHVLRG